MPGQQATDAPSKEQTGEPPATAPAPRSTPITEATEPTTPESCEPKTPVSEKPAETQRATQEKVSEPEAAVQDVAGLRQRKRTLERDIELEQQALAAEREKQDVLDATVEQLEGEYTDRSEAGATVSDLQSIRMRIKETQQQLREARNAARGRSDQLQRLRKQLVGLQAEEIHLIEEAEQKRRAAEAAKRAEWLISLRENAIVRGPKLLVTGFIVLLENQYKLNDFVTTGGISGSVERIPLRITVLRDFEGKVHFIPNGQITSVTNHTHGWARSVLNIDVA